MGEMLSHITQVRGLKGKKLTNLELIDRICNGSLYSQNNDLQRSSTILWDNLKQVLM